MATTRLYDLHMHTNYSDGVFPIEKLVTYMKQGGINVMAITDHDNIDAFDIAKEITSQENISIIRGVEVTTSYPHGVVHIVGLNMSIDSNEFTNLLANNNKIREVRSNEIDKSLSELGYPGALDYIKEEFKPKVFGRLHFAKFLCDKGYVNGINKAFKNILSKDTINTQQSNWPSLQEVISAIHSANGVAVLAHPLKYKFSKTHLTQLIDDFSKCDGDGMELISGYTTHTEVRKLRKMTKQYNLKGSIGSDFHAPWHSQYNAAKYNQWMLESEPIWTTWGTH